MHVSDPKKFEDRPSPWQVSASINGKRVRKYFKTYQLALAYRNDLLEGASEVGEKNLLVDPSQVGDFQSARNLLPPGITLTEVVSQWLAWGGGGLTGVKLNTALERYWKRMEDRDLAPGTYNGYRHCHQNLVDLFGDRDAGEDISKDLEKTFFKWFHEGTYAWRTIKRHLAYMSGFYSWAVRERLSRDNWTRYIELAKEPKVKKQFLTAAETEKLLRLAQDKDPGLVNYLVLGLFAGLRPMEIRDGQTGKALLDFNRIDWDLKSIPVLDAKDVRKDNSTNRFVEDLPGANLAFKWLEAYKEFGLDLKNYRKRLDKLLAELDLDKRVGSLFRKSFATHAVPLQGVAKTALQMGHTNSSTTEKHYKGLVTQADGWEYFSITP